MNAILNTLLFLNILFSNWKINIKYAHPKYKLYNIRPFSLVPHPSNTNIIIENRIHKNDTLVIYSFLFIIALIIHSISITIPNILNVVIGCICHDVNPNGFSIIWPNGPMNNELIKCVNCCTLFNQVTSTPV